MKTVQMTIDENLISSVDSVAKELGTTRSAFAREALVKAIKSFKIRKLEKIHAAGYHKLPPSDCESTEWEDEQVWGE